MSDDGAADVGRARRTWFLVVCGIPAILVLVLGVGTCATVAYLNPAFSKEAWAASSDGRRRHAMARDLVESGRLIGMTRADVIELLGRPEGPVHSGEIAYIVDWGLIDPWVLSIELDADDRVRTAFIYLS